MHVDFGEIAHAPTGYSAGAWREQFGGEPSIANYLFYPQPTTMVATSFLPCPQPAAAEPATRPRPDSRGGTQDPLGGNPEGFVEHA